MLKIILVLLLISMFPQSGDKPQAENAVIPHLEPIRALEIDLAETYITLGKKAPETEYKGLHSGYGYGVEEWTDEPVRFDYPEE